MVKKNKKKGEKIIEKNNLMNTILVVGVGLYSLAKASGMLSIRAPGLKISGNTTTDTLSLKNLPTYDSNIDAINKGAEPGTVYKVSNHFNALGIVV